MIYSDLARINHWQPSEMDELEWSDLVWLHSNAIDFFKAKYGIKEK